MSSETHLRIDRPSDGVALLTLDLPEMMNAMSGEMTASWVAAIADLKQDPTVRCVVVTGAGRAFSSGGNTSWLADSGALSVPELREQMIAFYRSWLSIRELEVPTIAAINGAAIGAGLCIALACDIRYAAGGAKMGAPFVKLGLHPGMASTFLFPDVAGEAVARDLLLTGRIIEAHEALQLGLVSRVIEADGFLDEVLATATQVAATAPLASKFTKVSLRRRHATLEDCLQWEAMAQPITFGTEDLQEGIRAVQEKRAPRFTGR
jgi:enoyl-CoA hydratase/carnithine racemase